MGRELPAKESALFKSILKFYEHKQYKKGLKAAEQILKKFPNHGETLAMKGLYLSHLERKEEAHEFIKQGLRNDLTSHICWHVYGLLHRADKNYEEAIKCYSHALKYDKENIQIIRDYSLLQIQMRNYEGFNETRHQLLALRPTNRMYWVGLAISYHLLQNYDTAYNVLQKHEESLKEESVVDFEQSEMLLYRNMILEESGDLERAVKDLDQIKDKVVDRRAWKEARANVLMKAGNKVEAQKLYESLLATNPDCHAYIDGLRKCKNLKTDNAEDREKLVSFYADLAKTYPRAHAIKRIPLAYADGERFRSMVDEYLQPMFRKGVPSLFVSIKDLYGDAQKAKIVEELVLAYCRNLREKKTFSDDSAADDVEPPSAYLWVLYFLAQHYDYFRDSATALKYVDEAIAHTPTLVELYMAKARIYKHGGDAKTAREVMDVGRKLDLQDRHINSKCTKYMLRNNEVATAERTIVLFTRTDTVDQLADLVDMQCMWFALECAHAHVRLGQIGKALKRFHQIEKHFVDIYDDQFDFHSYCLRKMTLKSYIGLLRLEDRLRSHPFYFQAAVGAIKCYLRLHDKPVQTADEKENMDLSNMNEGDRKKALRKARKAELKKMEEKKDVDSKKETAKSKKTDEDPDGKKYLENADPLGEAVKFLRPLLELSPSKIECWVLGSEIYLKKKKYLLALRCLCKAHALDRENPDLHKNVMAFYQAVNDTSLNLPTSVRTVISKLLPPLVSGSTDMVAFNQSFLDRHASSLPHVLAGASMMLALGGDRNSAADKIVNVAKNKERRGWELETCIAAHKMLVTKVEAKDRAEAFRTSCRSSFPLSTYFRDVLDGA